MSSSLWAVLRAYVARQPPDRCLSPRAVERIDRCDPHGDIRLWLATIAELSR